jgi:choline dehydrogenase-like flavoprotein
VIVSGATAPPVARRHRAVVVGTGPGGASVAAKLASAGWDVGILEAGPYARAKDFTQREGDMVRLLYYEGGTRGTEDGSMAVLHGRAVGGSSVVNFLDCFRTPDRLLHQWSSRHGLPELAPEKMAPRWRRIEETLHVAQIEPSQLNANNGKLKRGTDALGWKGACFHRNAFQCYGSGFCDMGCAYNAKQSSALTFIPIALQAGATLYTECRAERIVTEGSRAVAVEGAMLGQDRAERGRFRLDADLVVVSGGALETPYLLLRSGLDDPSGQVGRNLFMHPGTPVVGHFPGERIANYEGIKQGYYVSEFSWVLEEHPLDVLLEGIGAPPGITATVIPGFGAEHRKFFSRYNEFASVGVLLRDLDPGRVEVGDGRPAIHYTLSERDGRRMNEACARAAEVWLAAGAEVAITPHARTRFVRRPSDLRGLLTAGFAPGELALFNFHQMGSCRMGGSRDRDACDPTGRLWAWQNLHVADASVFPTASGVNPQISVYGLADVIGDAILGR